VDDVADKDDKQHRSDVCFSLFADDDEDVDEAIAIAAAVAMAIVAAIE
jgi:hypothetical protein